MNMSRRFLLVALVTIAVAVVLSSCMMVKPKTNIMTIREAINAAATSTVNATITGVVTYAYGDSILIEDDTAAIEVYLKSSNFSKIYENGDKLKVFGKIKEYKGNWEIVPASTSDVTKIGTSTIKATLIATDTSLSTSDDWMLMKVMNLPVKKVADKYYNVVLSNGNAEITINSYDANVRKWLTSLATNDVVSVQGYVKYNYGAYKLFLRDENDILK